MNKQWEPVLYTPSRGSFLFGRSVNGVEWWPQSTMARSFVQINFQRGQGYTRGRLRFVERNCRNRNRWIFQHILCSALALPRLMVFAHTCRVLSFPPRHFPSSLTLVASSVSSISLYPTTYPYLFLSLLQVLLPFPTTITTETTNMFIHAVIY